MANNDGGQGFSATRRTLSLGVCATLLAGCDVLKPKSSTSEAAATADGPRKGTLEWAVKGPWRPALDRQRDGARHPMETLRFFGLGPRMKVVDFWPGSGWYTEIIAPYLAQGGGKYVCAGFQTEAGAPPAQVQMMRAFRERFLADPELYGDVEISEFGPAAGVVSDPNTADLVLFMRTLHAWMAAGLAEKAFAEAYTVLRPGGVLGIEQHRLDPDEDQDPAAASGYVQEAFVRQLAQEAGFVFVEASEINANAADTKNHPFGTDTLPPIRQSAPSGQAPNARFDHSRYDEIGESDRMTLKFRKPE